MKILMVNKFLHPNGGSETYVFKLGEYLSSIGHEVQYFGMEHEQRCVGNNAEQYTSNMDFHTKNPLKMISYSLKIIYSPEARKKLTTVLNDFQPDIIHINNFNFQLTPSIIYASRDYKKRADKKVKIIFTAHDYQLVCPNHMMHNNDKMTCEECINGSFKGCIKHSCIHQSKIKSIIGAIEGWLYKALRVYKHFDNIICCSSFLESKLKQNPAIKDKTITIHNFVENVEKKDIKKEDYALFFSRFSKEKGIETILSAKNINFICAGSGEYDSALSECEHTTNVGFKSGEELEELIRKAKCSVYPSQWYEGCPFSIMESIMYGTPVVASRLGGMTELIDDGKTGFLFDAGNVEQFENAINKIMQDNALAKQMSDSCLASQFDTIETYTEKLLKVYNS